MTTEMTTGMTTDIEHQIDHRQIAMLTADPYDAAEMGFQLRVEELLAELTPQELQAREKRLGIEIGLLAKENEELLCPFLESDEERGDDEHTEKNTEDGGNAQDALDVENLEVDQIEYLVAQLQSRVEQFIGEFDELLDGWRTCNAAKAMGTRTHM